MLAKALFTFVATLSASLGVMYLNAPPQRAAKPAPAPASEAGSAGWQEPTHRATEDSEAYSGRRYAAPKPRCTKPCCR